MGWRDKESVEKPPTRAEQHRAAAEKNKELSALGQSTHPGVNT